MSTTTAVWFSAAVFVCIVQVFLTTLACNEASNLRMGAFNSKTFGKAKWNGTGSDERKPILTQMVLRYDIFVVTEIRNKYLEWVNEWWAAVNETRPYGLVISLPLGRNSYKEQTGVFYRDDKVIWMGNFTYNDSADVFQREPLCVRFRKNGTGSNWDFAVIGVHIKPDDALNELTNMTDVYTAVQEEWNDVEDIVLMGDFNAAGTYMSDEEIASLAYAHGKIFNNMMMHWVINSSVDTTVAGNDYTYDRIVVSGPNMPVAVVPDTAGAWRFNETFNLIDDQLDDISDHFPVEYCMYWWDVFGTE